MNEDRPEGDSSKKKQQKSKSGLTLKWEVIAISLGIFSLASLSVIVVLVSTRGNDLLAAVALLLAVLSFAAQLIVTGVQSASASKNYEELSALVHKTDVSLTTINTRVKELLETQGGHFTKLLQTVIDRMADPEKLIQMMGEVGIRADISSGDGGEDSEKSDTESLSEGDLIMMAEKIREELTREARAAVEVVTRATIAGPEVREKRFLAEQAMLEGLARMSTLKKSTLDQLLPRMILAPSAVIFRSADDVPEWLAEAKRAGLVMPTPWKAEVTGGEGRAWRLTLNGRAAKDALRGNTYRLSERIHELAKPFREMVREASHSRDVLDSPIHQEPEIT